MLTRVSYQEAAELVLKNVKRTEAVEVPVLEGLGLVLAENVKSPWNMPDSRTSGPDGYALRAADIKGASSEHPAVLRTAGTSSAGHPFCRILKPGTAVRIMTGSVVPEGADCVVRFEDTDEPAGKNGPNTANPAFVKIFVTAQPGDNIRNPGSNALKGEMGVKKGTVLGPVHLAVLAGLGRSVIRVFRKPAAAIITTGDEVLDPGKPMTSGKIYNFNQTAMAASVEVYGGIPRILGTASDNPEKLEAVIRKALALKPDMILASGGVSMGDFDFMRLFLEKNGRIVFSRLKLGPGGAAVFALIKDNDGRKVPFFALSGYPSGCLLNMEIMVRPAVKKMLGFEDTAHPSVKFPAGCPVKAVKKNMCFAEWVHLEKTDGEYAVMTDPGKSVLPHLGRSGGFVITEPGKDIEKGEEAEVFVFD